MIDEQRVAYKNALLSAGDSRKVSVEHPVLSKQDEQVLILELTRDALTADVDANVFERVAINLREIEARIFARYQNADEAWTIHVFHGLSRPYSRFRREAIANLLDEEHI
jgi:hypothetical protein